MQSVIKNYFTESIQAQIVMTEALSGPIEQAASTIINALLNGNKVLTCGNSLSAASAQMFTAQLVSGIDIERPNLPAIALVADNILISSIANHYNQLHDIYAKQIQALGNQGDVLVVLSPNGNEKSIIQAVQDAVIKDLSIITLTGGDGGAVIGLLGQNDIDIRIPSYKERTISEMQLIVLNCLCQLIENTLFIHKEIN
ncbi:DnaA-interacting protein DiaA [Orbus hercynius]|uniref:DnaA-interacting protein DiaA n=1 Tax=Orbus hercynius TaxID=593135 RepID=A0A495RHN9_9GAMM|nr:SIS domain-containing protein [Orbus hercynius]RKS86810.1 DnaA-interacting protein DiaA [Orbus hercynius]